jgi:hypothetical protein
MMTERDMDQFESALRDFVRGLSLFAFCGPDVAEFRGLKFLICVAGASCFRRIRRFEVK